MHLVKEQIESLERVYRLNLINSISGIKPANLVGTQSRDGKDNLAIFSSVVHLGSSPAQLGLIMRPQSEQMSDTFKNISETGFYSINHVSESFIKNAHYTSAKLERDESEFDRMKISRAFVDGFHAPFVEESHVKIGMKHLESILLPNKCRLIIGTVELIVCPDDAVDENGQLLLEHYKCAGISGLNTYYSLRQIDSFPYVRQNEMPEF